MPSDSLSEPVSSYKMAELPEHERPRERLISKGADALSDIELLAILLRTGSRKLSVLDLAQCILLEFDNSLEALAQASVGELRKISGIGPAKAVEIHAALALARRLRSRDGTDNPRIEGPENVADLMRETFRGQKQEQFYALYLDTKNRVLKKNVITIGLLDRSQVHAREVFRRAVRESCSRVVLVHNHPSGDPTPSSEDIACTAELVQAGKIIGIEVLDHIVMGRRTATRTQDFLSFKSSGLL